MTTPFDLGAAVSTMQRLVRGVRDDQLQGPTPCPDYSVAHLADHVGGLALAFTAAARKEPDRAPGGPDVDPTRLTGDWRERIAADLDGLAEAWRDPAAWTGTTRAGGVELPGDAAAAVAMDELVLHGWDLARATEQPYSPDPLSLVVTHDFVASMSRPGSESGRAGLFGPVVDAGPGAPLLDKVVGLAGRDPAWRPPGARG